MGNGASDGKGGGMFFWRKKKVLPAPRDPLRKAAQIMNTVEAKERILSAIKVVNPGTTTRWDKVLGIINRFTAPSEEEPYPLNIMLDFDELKEIMKLLFNDVKFISSDGLALLRTYIPKLYDKHSVERCRLLSQKERDERSLMDEAYAYGEIEAEIFATIYLKVVSVYGANPEGVFYDLGCGVGTLVSV